MTRIKYLKGDDPREAKAPIRFSLAKILSNLDEERKCFVLSVDQWAKYVKGIPLRGRNNQHELSPLERDRYKNQLQHLLNNFKYKDWKFQEKATGKNYAIKGERGI